MRLSDTEWTVMQAVWQLEPSTAREVHAAVEAETAWSYSTVRTLLTRLVEKGALTESKRGNQSVYESVLSSTDARRTALRSLVEKAFGGTFGSLVQHLAAEEKLTRKERDEIARLVDEGSARRKSPPRRKKS
ncbi:MAG: BlaI/MecI/CopY family transcriptional regulator [Planctomycetota bacterium]